MRREFLAILVTALLCSGAAAQKSAPSLPWPRPDPPKLARGPWKDAVLYGRRLIVETPAILGPEAPNKAMRYAGNNLSCQSCHLQAGTKQFGLPLIGAFAVYPAYMGREDQVRTLEDRINGCFERSMNGRALPVDSKEMKAIVAYLAFISEGIPLGSSPKGRGTPSLPLLSRAADPERGSAVYEKACAACHQVNGLGQRAGVKGDAKGYVYPPLWGADSFNDGAGMHRLIAAAAFIHANMPFGATYTSPTLSNEDAWDVAAYINSQPRPKRAHLERDYPNRSRKPMDAPFPPFADKYPPAQHGLGPYQPMLDAKKGH